MTETSRSSQERSSWATISILIVVVLFGMFWLWQKDKINKASLILQLGTAETSPTNSEPPHTDFSLLEASAVNISIPHFETVL